MEASTWEVSTGAGLLVHGTPSDSALPEVIPPYRRQRCAVEAERPSHELCFHIPLGPGGGSETGCWPLWCTALPDLQLMSGLGSGRWLRGAGRHSPSSSLVHSWREPRKGAWFLVGKDFGASPGRKRVGCCWLAGWLAPSSGSHLWPLPPQGEDLHELRRHIYADTVDFFTVKRLVQKILPSCKCRELRQKQWELRKGSEVEDTEMLAVLDASGEEQTQRDAGQPRVCHRHERAVPIQQTVEALDFREEGIETLLCYLELHPCHWVELLHPTFSTCRTVCYGGPRQLRAIAQRCPPIAVCLAQQRLKGMDHTHTSSVEFDVVELADSMGWEVLPVKRALRQLQWTPERQNGSPVSGKSGVLVEFSELSFHLRSYGDLTDEELDSVCDFLHRRVMDREKAALRQLQVCFQAFQSVAFQSCASCCDLRDEERSLQLKALLMDYFEREALPGEADPAFLEEKRGAQDLQDVKLRELEEQIRADIRHFLSIRQDEKFSSRAVARIFHGIGSPRYPAQVFGRDRRFWRRYIHFDFNRLMRLATEEIIRWQ